ncbi:hypothetical protein CIT292_07020 [Citrobacter youngae ATCC 29220]|uniref:Uncharacterized protein n=1 Tax=Citrobacter youngae ATCC 29220 TaxID=500640 RepID=D4B980_9ENTR|nr:hypothetical protein CIT292_07020 [Citrobacter youngae ATCC 29220]
MYAIHIYNYNSNTTATSSLSIWTLAAYSQYILLNITLDFFRIYKETRRLC